MKYLKFTYVDSVTGISIAAQPAVKMTLRQFGVAVEQPGR